MSGVAHELNNPLATILACAERLAARRLDEQTRRDLDAIHNAAERAARIVRNLQTFARKRHTTRTTVDLNQVVRETLALRAYEQRAANVVILEALAAGLPPVFADPHQIQQVLLNLIINAEQAMLDAHGRGMLILRSWHDPDATPSSSRSTTTARACRKDVQPKIFDPFFTTKAVGKGTGLGLTVAYAIAQEHGGRHHRESRSQGRGASFFLELPVSGVGREAARAGAARAPLPRRAARHARAGHRRRAGAERSRRGRAGRRRLRRRPRAERRRGARPLARAALRRRDLRSEDAEGRRHHVLPRGLRRMPHVARRLIFVTGDVAGTEAERFLEECGCRWVPKPFRLKDLVRAGARNAR